MDTQVAQTSLAKEISIPFELEALNRAHRYQKWVFDLLQPHLGQRIIEFGAGVGNLSRWLPVRERLILTEFDPYLLRILREETIRVRGEQPSIMVESFDLSRDDASRYYEENLDTVVSFNVLEHVENDHSALERQLAILKHSKASGPRRLCFFVPAHQWAFGTMDRTFGHFRRYGARQVKALIKGVEPGAHVSTTYFNLPGLLGWILQGRILKRTSFGASSVDLFEALCPIIRPMDSLLHSLPLPLGQSLLCVVTLKS